jgi:chloramphenicol O-acetyltransferase type A
METPYDLMDIEHWDRREAFRFFRDFDEPFFNICTTVDITGLMDIARSKELPASLMILWQAIRAANRVEAFRLRLHGDEVRRYHCIKPACTMRRGENGFFFSYLNYEAGMTAEEFILQGRQAIESQQSVSGLGARPDALDVVHCSILPWTSFTGLKHARHSAYPDSIPKFVFGKFYEASGKILLPVGIDLHHALADGWHAAQFLEQMEWK